MAENKPVPDPTALTTDALHRAIEQLKELLDTKLDERDLRYEERFGFIESRRVEQKTDTQQAVKDAFAAAKEAVAKEAEGTGKILDRIVATFDTAIADLRRNLDEAKTCLTSAEATKAGSAQAIIDRRAQTTQTGANVHLVYGGLAAIATLLTIIFALTRGGP